MTISVVVPALDERERIGATLARLREPGVLEVIVVDGGSTDGTPDEARRFADVVLSSPSGRARQMNAGARAARGDVLFFLHADTLVPAGWTAAIARALRNPATVGGRFDVEIEGEGILYRLTELGMNTRSRWSRLSTGDQGLFVRREAFERLGAFPELPLFEDLAMSAAMKRSGGIACLRERVRTSGRRWQKRGVLRTILFMWVLRALWAVGFPPERLARVYDHVR